jgi:hypothetical protein
MITSLHIASLRAANVSSPYALSFVRMFRRVMPRASGEPPARAFTKPGRRIRADRRRLVKSLLATTCVVLTLSRAASADTYSTFKTTKYYSAGRAYYLRIDTKMRATLYRAARRPKLVWARTLPAPPQRVLVSKDGRRVILLDFYYGNMNAPDAAVVKVLDERGRTISQHVLEEVTDLERALTTTSGTSWLEEGWLSEDEKYFYLKTDVAKCPLTRLAALRSAAEINDCLMLTPYEQLKFSVYDGALISRQRVAR